MNAKKKENNKITRTTPSKAWRQIKLFTLHFLVADQRVCRFRSATPRASTNQNRSRGHQGEKEAPGGKSPFSPLPTSVSSQKLNRPTHINAHTPTHTLLRCGRSIKLPPCCFVLVPLLPRHAPSEAPITNYHFEHLPLIMAQRTWAKLRSRTYHVYKTVHHNTSRLSSCSRNPGLVKPHHPARASSQLPTRKEPHPESSGAAESTRRLSRSTHRTWRLRTGREDWMFSSSAKKTTSRNTSQNPC